MQSKSIHEARYRRLIVHLRSARKIAKVSQLELAERLGFTQSQVSKIERCERRLDVVEFTDYCHAIGLGKDDIADLIAVVMPRGRRSS